MKQLFGFIGGGIVGWAAGYLLGFLGGAWTGTALGAIVGVIVAQRFQGEFGLGEGAFLRSLVGGFGGLMSGAAYGAAITSLGAALFFVFVGLFLEGHLTRFIDVDTAQTGAIGAMIAGTFYGAAFGAVVGAPAGFLIGAVIGGIGDRDARLEEEARLRKAGLASEMESTMNLKAADLSGTQRTTARGPDGGRAPAPPPLKAPKR